MSHLKLRGVPWSIYPGLDEHYSAGGFKGWHPNQEVISNKSTVLYEAKTMDGITWWGDTGSVDGQMEPENVFGTAGSATSMVNGKRHNTVFFLGTYTDHANFTNSEFTYPSDARSSMMRNVAGFGCRNSCTGSHSDSGGNAQAFLEKVGLFYAHPTTRKRSTFTAYEKVSGSHSLNSHYPNKNWYHYAYRLSSTSIRTIRDQKLVFMGMALQFVHDCKASKHTSRCSIKDMRVFCCEDLNTLMWQNTTRIMLIDSNKRTLSEYANGHAMEIAY